MRLMVQVADKTTVGSMSDATSRPRRLSLSIRPQRTISRSTLLYLVPALTFYVFVLVLPSLRGARYAFTDWDGLAPTFEFVGFSNFVEVVTSPGSRRAIFVTLIIAFTYMVAVNLLGLLLALGVDTRIKTRNFLRVLLFAPAVMTPVVTAHLWKYILAPTGPLNSVLGALGLESLQQSWLGSPGWALFSIVLVMVWQFAGYHMVIFLAGLQAIPDELVEAAEVDGAGPFQRLRHVKLPLLAPATTINLVLSMIGALKVFDQIWVITGGGPGGATHNLSTLLYRDAFQYGRFGTSIAMALILTLLVAGISGFQYRQLAKRELRT